jgi:hypothetical protein
VLRAVKQKKIVLAVATAALAMSWHSANAATYAPWLAQMGVSDAVLSAANWGKGQVLGVVDTGIIANNTVFAAGQVSNALSSCAAVSFKCAKGVVDDNGHGTAVAAIAAANSPMPFAVNYGGYATPAGSVIGMAPNANIVAEKVLNASGSGYSTDVANGLIKAANAGASVINLSLTFGNSSDLVNAINYAASKGSFIVWAGGNSAQALLNGANTSGLTAAAVSHLILAGSVSSKNTLSSFSNTPGTGSLVNISGAKTSYAARWVMAPGENILAPYALAGNGSYAAWSGTSMSAPLVSGALMLLQSAWPILKTKGTTADLLLTTSTDLGVKGVDNSYGNGLVNLGTAFQPNGALMITQANGKAISVTSLTGSLISGGALGSLSAVQSKLASYTTLDSYQRNFSVNLSGLIKSPATAATRNPLPVNTNTGPNKMSLADGAELAYVMPALVDRTTSLGVFGLNQGEVSPKRTGYAMLTDSHGTSMALGYGNTVPVQYSYARALFGSDDAALAAGELSTHLSALSQGGSLMAYGTSLGSGTRLAVSYSSTASADMSSLTQSTPWANPSASSFGVGVTQRLNDSLQIGFSLQSLNEEHGLLGSTYDASSALSLGSGNRSQEFGVSALVNLDRDNSIYLEATRASTRAATPVDGSMFAGTSALRAQSFGMSYTSRNLFAKADRLTVSLKQPLRVTSGAVNLAVTNIDPLTGIPSVGVERVSLAPSGREIDYMLSYDAPLSKFQKLSLQAGYVKDSLNMAGNNSTSVGMIWSSKF